MMTLFQMLSAVGGGSCPAAPPPAPCSHPLPTPHCRWGSLSEPLLLLILNSLSHNDLAAVHLVARGWRDATRLAVRRLRFCGHPPDTGRIKQASAANVAALLCLCSKARISCQ